MRNPSVARHAREPTTREERGLALFRERGGEIRHLYGDTYRVPGWDGERVYGVEYGPREYCSCSDHRYRDETCIHLYALGIAMAKGAIVHPELAAGDPFAFAHKETHDDGQDHPHACTDGLVFLTYTVFDPDLGVEVERLDVIPCRRCQLPL